MQIQQKLAVVTGAGSGIGRAIAVALAEEGARLAISDIDAHGLETTAALLGKACVDSRSLDVAKRDGYQAYAEQLCAAHGVPDIVVNNAGVALVGPFSDTQAADWDWIMNINLQGVFHGCHFFGIPMAEKGCGQIVNIASGFGLVAGPGMSAYCASKFAVVGLSESLRIEMASQGVGVTTVCPGVVSTNIVAASRMKGRNANRMRARTKKLYQKRNYGPEKVAAATLKAIKKNMGLVPVCTETHMGYLAKRLLPSTAPRLLAGLMPQ